MGKEIRRGYVAKDEIEFQRAKLGVLRKAAEELCYLLERGYPVKSSVTFIGNHYLLSERQRTALSRVASSKTDCDMRRKKQLSKQQVRDTTVYIDGFNTIITLEVAMSRSLVLQCMDGTIRDLAGLRGNYRISPVTYKAVRLLLTELVSLKVREARIYLDAPISNSGNLKKLILEEATSYAIQVEVLVISEVDSTLEQMSPVITSDAIILNRADSWFNLNRILMNRIPEVWCVDFTSDPKEVLGGEKHEEDII